MVTWVLSLIMFLSFHHLRIIFLLTCFIMCSSCDITSYALSILWVRYMNSCEAVLFQTFICLTFRVRKKRTQTSALHTSRVNIYSVLLRSGLSSILMLSKWWLDRMWTGKRNAGMQFATVSTQLKEMMWRRRLTEVYGYRKLVRWKKYLFFYQEKIESTDSNSGIFSFYNFPCG